jgi:hypothetical protein
MATLFLADHGPTLGDMLYLFVSVLSVPGRFLVRPSLHLAYVLGLLCSVPTRLSSVIEVEWVLPPILPDVLCPSWSTLLRHLLHIPHWAIPALAALPCSGFVCFSAIFFSLVRALCCSQKEPTYLHRLPPETTYTQILAMPFLGFLYLWAALLDVLWACFRLRKGKYKCAKPPTVSVKPRVRFKHPRPRNPTHHSQYQLPPTLSDVRQRLVHLRRERIHRNPFDPQLQRNVLVYSKTSTYSDILSGIGVRILPPLAAYVATLDPDPLDTIHPGLLQNPAAFRAGIQLNNMFTFVWDTGASHTVTHCADDFVDGIKPLPVPVILKGLASGLTVAGIGEVEWVVTADDGSFYSVRLPAYYIPESDTRLLSVQSYLQHVGNMKVSVDESRLKLSGKYWFSSAPTVTVLYASNNLPISNGYHPKAIPERAAELNLCVMDEANQNLSEAQKELLRWHSKLGHLNFEAIQMLLKSGSLGKNAITAAAARCTTPKCASCQFGKARRRPTDSAVRTVNPERDGALKQGDLQPGQRVSVDHFICSSKGRLHSSRGKTSSDQMYKGGCIFVDHCSSFIHVEHQVTLTSHETLAAKHTYERILSDMGVIAQSYQSDNGVFSSKDYLAELTTFKQTSRFAGVGAHHQNGVAERAIQTIMSMARTMMLHAAIRWPNTADAQLWPMAVDYAVYIYNHTPNARSGIAPIDIITRTQWPRHKLQSLHVWGSPTYVLDPKLQDGKKLPRWEPRSRLAMFMGFSAHHAHTIPMVLNLQTGHISPQYHVVHDDWYATIPTPGTPDPDESTPVPFWADLFHGSRFQYTFDDEDPTPELDPIWLTPDEVAHRKNLSRAQEIRDAQRSATPETTPVASPPPHEPRPDKQVTFSPEIVPPIAEPVPDTAVSSPPGHLKPVVPLRRSTRQRNDIIRLGDFAANYTEFCVHNYRPLSNDSGPLSGLNHQAAVHLAMQTHPISLEFEPISPAMFHSLHINVASRSDPDTLMYHQAMADPDRDKFKSAMGIEIDALIARGTWSEIP